jgi:hypothetical protein
MQDAAYQGNMSLFSWMNYTLQQNSTNMTDVNWQVQAIINATCFCMNIPEFSNGTAWGQNAYQMLNLSMDPFNQGANGSVFIPPLTSNYQSLYCNRLTRKSQVSGFACFWD